MFKELNPNTKFSYLQAGDTFATSEDFQESIAIWERKQERPSQKLPHTLLEVGLILDDLMESNGDVRQSTLQYVEMNEWTQAAEATSPGVIMTSHQSWEPLKKTLFGYGHSTIDIYKKGLADIPKLRELYGDKIEFESERRTVELLDAFVLNNSIDSKRMDTHVKVVISPFPIGADQETAKELGYFAEKGIAMVRLLDYDPNTKIMTTTQIMVEQTNLDAFTRLTELLQGDPIDKGVLTPPELLGSQIYVPKEKLRGGVLDIARIYDRILESKTGKRHFLGEQIGNEEKDYVDILRKSKIAREQTKPIINFLVETDIEIAKSLQAGIPTENLINTLKFALQRNESGESLISEEKRKLIINAIYGTFGIQEAQALKEFVTKNNYLSMICITNPQRAAEIFNKQEAESFRNEYLNGTSITMLGLPPITPNQEIRLFFCGASLTINSGQNIGVMSPGELNSMLREGEKTLCCKCPYCGKQVEAKIANGRITCPKKPDGCGTSVPYNPQFTSSFSLN